jgi:uncharacterized phage-associated protein
MFGGGFMTFFEKRRGFVLIAPVIVANNFIKRAKDEDISVTPLKLQKLVYFLYREYLIKTGESLFTERFETWKYGPVLPSIYSEFNSYGDDSIKTYSKDSQGKSFSVNETGIFKTCIDSVWEKYKFNTGLQLSNMTHEPGTAWSKAKDAHSPYLKDEDIMNEAIS